MSADDLRFTDGAASAADGFGGGGGGGMFSTSFEGGGAALPLPLTEAETLAREDRTDGVMDFASADTLRGVAFFAALEVVDMADRMEIFERVEWFDAEDTERWTASPRFIVASAEVGVRRDGVTRRDRTDDAALDVVE